MTYPVEYRYTKDHEWVKPEGARARIGITKHAQEELGDIVFVELPTPGRRVQKGENLATVESVKAVGEINAPFEGTVVEVNTALESSPEMVNQSPHDKAWIVLFEPADQSEADRLMSAAEYERLLAEG